MSRLLKTGEWADIKKNETDVRTTEAEKEDARGNRLTKKALSKALLKKGRMKNGSNMERNV